MHYADVILPLPLDNLFTYAVTDPLADRLKAGMRITVPFGRTKTYTAIFVKWHEGEPDFEAKSIIDILDSQPVLRSEQLRLWQWISNYYMSPLGDVYKAALPAGLFSRLSGFEEALPFSPPYQTQNTLVGIP